MIKHECPGSSDGFFPARILYFADPGEQSVAEPGAVTYERASTDVGMVCPQCGAEVPYKITPRQTPDIVKPEPKFETIK